MANDGHVKIGTELDESGLKKGLSGLGSFAKKGFSTIGSVAAITGKAIVGAIGAAGTAISGIGTYAIKVGSDFEAGMSQVGAISGATADEMELLAEKAKEMGASTKFSATESAEAFNYMAMAGWKTSDMLSGIEGIMNLAAASGEDLASTSDIVTDALTAFGLSAKDSGHFADILAAASSNANTNVSMMGETFKYVAPLAGSLGFSAEDTATAIGLMANAGIKAGQAGTSLRSIMTRLAKPTKEVSAAMKVLGLSITDSSGTMKPLSEIIADMRKGFAGLTEDEKVSYAAMLGGQEAMSGLLAIVNASDKDFSKLSGAINDCNGSAAEMAEIMQDNLQGQLTIMKSATEGLGLAIYENLQEPLTDIVKLGTECIDELTEAFKSEGVEGLVEAGGSLLSNILIGASQQLPTLVDFSVLAIDSLLATIETNLPKLITAGSSILQSFAAGAEEILPSLLSIGAQILQTLYDGVISGIPMLFSAAGELLSNIASGLEANLPMLVEKGNELISSISQSITDNLPGIVQSGAQILTSLVTGFAQMLPNLLNAAVDGIISLALALTDPNTLTGIIEAGITLLTSLVSGIMEALPKLIEAAPTILANLVSAIIANLPRLVVAAVEIMRSLAKGMLNAIAELLKTVPRIYTELSKKFKEINWGDIGRNLIEGIKKGISEKAASLVESVLGAAKDAVSAVKNFLGIASPSKLMRDLIGKNMIAGINVGIEKETPELEKTSTYSAKRAVESMQGQALGRSQKIASDIGKIVGGASGSNPDEVKVVLEKGSITGDVTMDGEKVGTLVAPTVDIEIEKARKESER